ncbi:MAG: DNA gyrase subunit A [Oceanicaulis sp.]
MNEGGPRGGDTGSLIAIEDEMKRSYLDYAMSVIVSRAIPDARDGLKPVHRRILWAMHEGGYTKDKPYKKSANVVGDVMGRYHPHGDSAIYDALARMAQPFSMGLKLLDGQGNFGSMDGDPPAAMRYTEIRMDHPAEALLADIDKETVDFVDNYDGSKREPTVLPARYPNLLVNGAGGIAVGMATNIPPHNLNEIVDATLAILDNPDITDGELLEFVPAPDFPTGGEILGRSGARKALMEGRGSVILRGKCSIEQVRSGREAIIVHEIPYQVNKAVMVEKIAELVRDKRVEGVADLRDESDRSGVRVVVELKKDANADVILNQLYRWSPLQTSFGVNMLALIGGRPQQAGLRTFLETFIGFRKQVVVRRTKFDLKKARDRAHVLIGLGVAVANIDEVIRLIRSAPDPQTAREQLRDRAWPAKDITALVELVADPRSKIVDGTIKLTEEQAKAILDLRLHRLTALGRDEIGDEAKKLAEQIADLLDILKSPHRIREIIRGELEESKAKFGVERRSTIIEGDLEIEDEDLIPRDDMVVTLTHGGYVKRTPLSTYRAQHRGGRGRAGMAMKDEDFVATLFVASTHAPLLFFSSDGMVYKTKTWRLPVGAPNSRGKFLTNLLPSLNEGAWITSVMALPEDEESWDQYDVMFATAAGTVRRNSLSDFVQVNRNGKIAMKLDEETGRILDVRLCRPDQDVLLVTANGKAIRFPVTDVRVFASRNSTGVRGIRMEDGDRLISMAILNALEVSRAEVRAYLKQRRAELRSDAEDELETAEDEIETGEDGEEEVTLSNVRYMEMKANEELLLTVAESGLGKRVISYEYFRQGRGGQGVWTKDKRFPEPLSACFAVGEGDTVMAVTDGGQLIRFPVDTVRIAARATKGVRLIRLSEGEKVVSVVRVAESDDGEGGDPEDAPEDAPAAPKGPEGEG